jgi:hypothetical protein
MELRTMHVYLTGITVAGNLAGRQKMDSMARQRLARFAVSDSIVSGVLIISESPSVWLSIFSVRTIDFITTISSWHDSFPGTFSASKSWNASDWTKQVRFDKISPP